MKELQIDKKNETQAFSFTPSSLDEAMKYATLIAESDLAPKDYKLKPGNVLVAIQMGHELGLKPMQAIQNIAVINGRPSIWGDAVLAIVMSHPEFEYIKEWHEGDTAYCTLKRRNQPEKTTPFSKAQAKVAGLLGKAGPWTTYPERMLQMRARLFCCRDLFSDALKGIHSIEEARDITREDYEVIDSKNNTNLLNEKINSYIPSLRVDSLEEKFNECSDLESLQKYFNDHKKNLSGKDLDDFVKLKDARKKQLQEEDNIIMPKKEDFEDVIKHGSIKPSSKDLNDWVSAFDKAEVK